MQSKRIFIRYKLLLQINIDLLYRNLGFFPKNHSCTFQKIVSTRYPATHETKNSDSNFENGLEGNSNKLSVVSSPLPEANNEAPSFMNHQKLRAFTGNSIGSCEILEESNQLETYCGFPSEV